MDDKPKTIPDIPAPAQPSETDFPAVNGTHSSVIENDAQQVIKKIKARKPQAPLIFPIKQAYRGKSIYETSFSYVPENASHYRAKAKATLDAFIHAHTPGNPRTLIANMPESYADSALVYELMLAHHALHKQGDRLIVAGLPPNARSFAEDSKDAHFSLMHSVGWNGVLEEARNVTHARELAKAPRETPPKEWEPKPRVMWPCGYPITPTSHIAKLDKTPAAKKAADIAKKGKFSADDFIPICTRALNLTMPERNIFHLTFPSEEVDIKMVPVIAKTMFKFTDDLRNIPGESPVLIVDINNVPIIKSAASSNNLLTALQRRMKEKGGCMYAIRERADSLIIARKFMICPTYEKALALARNTAHSVGLTAISPSENHVPNPPSVPEPVTQPVAACEEKKSELKIQPAPVEWPAHLESPHTSINREDNGIYRLRFKENTSLDNAALKEARLLIDEFCKKLPKGTGKPITLAVDFKGVVAPSVPNKFFEEFNIAREILNNHAGKMVFCFVKHKIAEYIRVRSVDLLFPVYQTFDQIKPAPNGQSITPPPSAEFSR